MLHVELSFVCYWNWDTSVNRSDIPGKFWNVVKEKKGENWLDRSCEKWRSIKQSQREIYRTYNTKKEASGIVYILRRNCLLKHVIQGNVEGRIDVTGRRRRRKQLLDDIKEMIGCCKLKEETLDSTVWRTRFVGTRFENGLWTCRKVDNRMND